MRTYKRLMPDSLPPSYRDVSRRAFSGLDECITTGHDLPILSSAPETEFIALPWQCEYCGSTNPGEALYCGQCGPSHCGASRLGGEELPRGVSQLREFGSFYVVEDENPLLFLHWCPSCKAKFSGESAYTEMACPYCGYRPCTINPDLSDDELHILLDRDREASEMRFYPEPTMRVTLRPGKSFEDFKLELGSRILAAYQKTIRGVLSLC